MIRFVVIHFNKRVLLSGEIALLIAACRCSDIKTNNESDGISFGSALGRNDESWR